MAPKLLRRTLTIAGAAALLAAPGAAAKVAAGSKTVTKGSLTATMSWKDSQFTTADGAHLKVTRDGTVVFNKDLEKVCQLCGSLGDPKHSVAIRDLAADGTPEVVADTFSGGAHCCYTSIIVWFDSYGAAHSTVQSWGNGSYLLQQLNGKGGPEFVTTDDRFAYAFTSYVASWRPPLIVDWENNGFVDRTRNYGKQILSDIHAIDKELPKIRDFDARGAVAARAADMALLGISADGIHRWLERARAKGETSGPTGYPKGQKFIAKVEQFLHSTGYIINLVP